MICGFKLFKKNFFNKRKVLYCKVDFTNEGLHCLREILYMAMDDDGCNDLCMNEKKTFEFIFLSLLCQLSIIP